MKKVNVKISYEPESDVLAWETGKQAIDYAQEIGNMIVHFDKKNNPVLVEILEASKFLSQAKKLVVPNTGKKSRQPILA
ncbi:MAG: DUF2283 domain-containing protein [Candidatus Doudnabacteria bacterium]|nr:DUF2283 domain-containing protein [Candidatus Doudnabacteria bacterium]